LPLFCKKGWNVERKIFMADPVAVVSLEDLQRNIEKEVADAKVADQYLTLEGALRDIFIKHQTARREAGIDDAMIKALYSYSSLYDYAKERELTAAGMSKVFVGLIEEKCTDAMAWLEDVFLGETDKPWKLKATPVPTVPADMAGVAQAAGAREAKRFLEASGGEPKPEDIGKVEALVRQAIVDAVTLESERRVKGVERKLQDQLVEGGWNSAFKDFLFDVVVEKAAILKGPVIRERQKPVWARAKDGKSSVKYEWKATPTLSRVSPFDAYPSASSVGFEGDFIERTRFTLADLFWMLKQKHFNTDRVRSLLSDFQALAGADVQTTDSEVAPVLRGQTGQAKVADTLEGLDFWLTVTGDFLRNAGWKEVPRMGTIKAGDVYHIEVITVAGRVVFIGENDDPRGLKPYYKTGWVSVPGSFWYRGLPEVLSDISDICNAAARSLVNNMGLASGFQVVIPDIQRLLTGSLTTMFPHKVWQFKNPSNSSAPPVDFKQPDSNAQELLGIINECYKLSDSRSGVPKYLLGGSPPPGVGRTASGISMLLNSAAKGIRRVVLAVDRDAMCPLLKRLYEWNLKTGEGDGLFGDAEVAPSGAVETLVQTELAERRLSLLDAISKSPDTKLVGVRGRAELWREAFRAAEMDGTAILEPIEKLEQEAEVLDGLAKQEAQAKAQAAQADAQAKGIEAQTAQAKLEVEKQRLVMESRILELKLQAQIAENTQRSEITKRMAANVDLKTAQEIGAVNVPARKEDSDVGVLSGGGEADSGLVEPPGLPDVGGQVEVPAEGDMGDISGAGGAPVEPAPGGSEFAQ
jgi:hypothetical protein